MLSKMIREHAILRELSKKFVTSTHNLYGEEDSNTNTNGERKLIAVKQVDESILDTEFRNMRDIFEQEMTRIDGEMNKFAKYFNQISKGFLFPGSGIPIPGSPGGVHISKALKETNDVFESFGRWSCGVDTEDKNGWPLIEGVGPNRRFKLRFDLRGYRPEEVTVDVSGRRLSVYARCRRHCPGRTCVSQYHREFVFPDGTALDTVESELSKDGILTVKAKVPEWMQDNIT